MSVAVVSYDHAASDADDKLREQLTRLMSILADYRDKGVTIKVTSPDGGKMNVIVAGKRVTFATTPEGVCEGIRRIEAIDVDEDWYA